MASGITNKLRQSYSRVVRQTFSPQNRQMYKQNLVGAYQDWRNKPSNQIFTQLRTPQGQEQLTRTVSRNASYLPGGQALSTSANYVNNRYLAPIAQIPYSYNKFRKPGLTNKLQGAVGLLGGAATFLPDPIQDLAMPAYDFLKGANKVENRGKGFKTNLSSGLQSLSMEKPVGIGDVLVKDPTKQTTLNIAEFGGMFLVPGLLAGRSAKGFDNAKNKFSAIPDKQVRFEISDRQSILHPKKLKQILGNRVDDTTQKFARLGDFFSHQGLYKNYPEFSKLRVQFKAEPQRKGTFNRKTFSITLDPRLSTKEMRSTTLHEVQHAIQEVENFARGASPAEYKLNDYQIESLRYQKNKIEKILRNNAYDMMVVTPNRYKRLLKKLENDHPHYPSYTKGDDELDVVASYLAKQDPEYQDIVKQLAQQDGTKKYYSNWGEIEAFSVGRRESMSPLLRSKTDPYTAQMKATGVNRNDVIVRQNLSGDLGGENVAQPPQPQSTVGGVTSGQKLKPAQVQQQPPAPQTSPVQTNQSIAQTQTLPTQTLKQQTPTSTPLTPAPVSLPGEMVNSQISSAPIIQKPRKLNVNRLNLTDSQKQVVESLQDKTPNTVLANKSVVEKSKQTKGRTSIMSDEEMASRIASQLNSRQQVVTLSKQLDEAVKRGAPEQERLKIMQQIAESSRVAKEEGTFAGRLLQARNIVANELATPMQKIFGLLDNAGVDENKYMKDAVKVDWNNSDQVVAFYRKYVPPKLGEVIDEYRYTNMLSSPQTQINNAASNFLQTAIVAPVEKTIAGGIDAVRSALTGKERQYFARQGLDYSTGYVKSLPEAWKNFKNVLTGSMPTTRPDLENIPVSTKKSYKLYTTPLRLLEASDQFFRTLTTGGELKALKRAGVIGDDAIKRASQNAEYRLFRQGFDPEGKLGENVVLKTWDKWNSAIMSLRRAPGGKWIVPFIKTPTNILKQGLEYSPAGIVTVPGAKRPIEQLSKTIIGSSVFATAYTLANAGFTTWDTPTNKKEREMFYAAGLQPYSVKIGNNWVSYSKLGPLAYPIAMAAALKHIETTKPDQKLPQDAAEWVTQMLGFFGDQSYVKSIGDFVSALQGDGNKLQSAIESQIANVAGQLVPYRSFLGWVARTIDPVYRDANTTYERIVSQIPGLSEGVPPYLTPSGEASQRDYPLLNAVSPFKISQEKPEAESMYRSMQQAGIQKGILKREKNKAEDQKRKEYGKVSAAENVDLPTTKDDLSVLYKDANRIIGNYQENKVKSQYGLVDKGIEEYQAEVDQAIAMKKRIEKERPEMVFEIELDMYNKDSGSKVADRTKWIIKQLENSKDPNATVEKLYEGQVLTKSVIEELNEKYGFKLNKYNYGDGYRYTGGSGKKGKKAKKLISDAQILSAYKKAITAASKRPQSKKVASISNTTKPIKLKRSQVKMLY